MNYHKISTQRLLNIYRQMRKEYCLSRLWCEDGFDFDTFELIKSILDTREHCDRSKNKSKKVRKKNLKYGR